MPGATKILTTAAIMLGVLYLLSMTSAAPTFGLTKKA